MRHSACLLLVSDNLAHFCGEVRPVGSINLGPKMEPPQEMVMYDLVASGEEAATVAQPKLRRMPVQPLRLRCALMRARKHLLTGI